MSLWEYKDFIQKTKTEAVDGDEHFSNSEAAQNRTGAFLLEINWITISAVMPT